MAQDPYTVLGVSRQATTDEIRKAFRALAKKYHPDRNPGDKPAEEKFKAISRAFEIIGDPDSRAKFDRGEIDADGNDRPTMSRGPFGPGGAARWKARHGGQTSFDDISDIFGDFFGQKPGARGGPRPQKGSDVRYRLGVEFLDAALGSTKRVALPDGRTIDVTVPQGLRDGQTLRLRGKGNQGVAGGPPGDLFVEVSVRPHEFFEVKGNDLAVEVPITLKEAVLGAKIDIPTLDGSVKIRIPPNTSSGASFRLKEKGLKDPKSAAVGDLYARMKIVLPEKPDQHLKDLLIAWEPVAENPRKAFQVSG